VSLYTPEADWIDQAAKPLTMMNISTAIFTQQNYHRKHPMEDVAALGTNRHSYALADGVTRDSYSPAEIRYSGSAKSAKIFCESVLSSLKNANCDDDSLRHAFDRANRGIGELNRADGKGTDPIDNDYFGAVGAAAFICHERHLHFGYVGDCRIIVYGENGKILETPDDVAPVRAYLSYLKSHGMESKDTRSRLIRSHVRNNANFHGASGQQPGYGVFTGEIGVRDFYRVGRISLGNYNLILLFSDGMVPVVERDDFLRLINGFPERYEGRELQERMDLLCSTLGTLEPESYGDDKALILVRCQMDNKLGDGRIGDQQD
jgi:serine/threonine protein phosphatase PrpC